MSQVTMTSTPEHQIKHIRNILTALQQELPLTRSRPAIRRRTLTSNALEILDELEANLEHIKETGGLKTFGGNQ
jgi:hypothetical protein